MRCAHFARGAEEISRYSCAIAISRIGLVCGEFYVVDIPVRLQRLQFVLVDEVDSCSESALHLNILFEPLGLIRMDDAHESRLAKVSRLADQFLPILKHVQGDER